MKNVNIGLFGASGRMGEAIRKSISQQNKFSHFNLFLAVSSQFCTDFDFSVTNISDVEKDIKDQVDVWIDFSNVKNIQNYKYLKGKPIVAGMTGFSPDEFKKIKNYAKTNPIFWASNFSIGLWVVRQAVKVFSMIPNFDFSIDEIHHTLKKDNPSGTALTLQKDLEDAIGKSIKQPMGKRLGGVFGVHQVLAASQNEIIKIEHEALNREVFAEGALQAASWILNKKKGWYSMNDMMNSKN